MPPPQPALYRLADNLFEGRLAAWLAERRAAGDSWDLIAKKLWVETDQQIDISTQTLATTWARAAGLTSKRAAS
ncbi:MAG: hypothetical protein AB7H43_14530 [Acidimicrobiia bacterium]